MNKTKLAYKPIGLVLGMIAGAVSGMLFQQLWRGISGSRDAPAATDEDRRWGEVIAAAALQGAIFAVVKAVVDRGGAQGMRKLTGQWPA